MSMFPCRCRCCQKHNSSREGVKAFMRMEIRSELQMSRDADVQELVELAKNYLELLEGYLIIRSKYKDKDEKYSKLEAKSLKVKAALSKFEARNLAERMNDPAYCNFCRRITTTKEWDCTICKNSKPHPKDL